MKIDRPNTFYIVSFFIMSIFVFAIATAVSILYSGQHSNAVIAVAISFLSCATGLWLEKLRTKTLNTRSANQSVDYFNSLSDALVHLICVEEADTHKQSYNQLWVDYCGEDPNNEGAWGRIVCAEDSERIGTLYRNSHLTKKPFDFEYRIRRHSDGMFRWHLCRGIPVFDGSGNLLRWLFTSTDIHAQKTAEAEQERLRLEVEERTSVLASVLDQMPSGVIVIGPDKNVLRINHKAHSYFGIGTDHKIGAMTAYHNDGTLYQVEDWPVSRVFATGLPNRQEMYLEAKNGKKGVFVFNAAPILSKSGKIIAVVVNCDDISEAKQTEAIRAENLAAERAAAEIKRSQEFLETLVENIPYMIFLKDTETRHYIQINKAVKDYLGYGPEHIIGKTSEEIYAPEQAAAVKLTDDEAIRTNQVLITPRHELTLKGIGTRTFQTKKFVVPGYHGKKILVGISHDMTDSVLVEKQIIHAKDQAEQMAKIKSEFLANMSHEIRTPLNGVIGMTELLLEGTLDAQSREYATIAQDSGKALLGIVNDILDFSKVEAGQISIEHIEFDLRKFFHSHLESLKVRADAKDLTLTYIFDDKNPSLVKGDPNRISQVLNNLISNAIKFTSAGSIEVRVEPQLTRNQEAKIKFSVKDSGIGLTEEQKGRLFKPFVQGDGSMARRYGGTGLGLSISKQLVELMHGSISVESKKDEGSVFWFNVKLETIETEKKVKAKVEKPAAPIKDETNASQKHVLIAEDNTTNQILTEALLKRLGYIPHIVANGREALEATANFDYDLILMDCQMPELDGYEATIQIREREKTSHKRIPIVALTTNARSEDRDKCLSVGMDDFISKPIKRDFLEQVLRTWTAHKS